MSTTRRDAKSSLLFKRCIPTIARFSCISLTRPGQLRLINFSPSDKEMLKTCVGDNHLPDVVIHPRAHHGDSLMFDSFFELTRNPWNSHNRSLHAQSLLVHLFAKPWIPDCRICGHQLKIGRQKGELFFSCLNFNFWSR